MLTMITTLIGLISQLGMWWLGKVQATDEQKKNFLKFIEKMNKSSLRSVKLHDDWADLMDQINKEKVK